MTDSVDRLAKEGWETWRECVGFKMLDWEDQAEGVREMWRKIVKAIVAEARRAKGK